ncbi:sensor histidine kinase [Streptococcus merionis]|uniref:sensor histidine kinase n=1 Tax=Streptococcus merionis TaxID=400065 RepID=UPI0035122025
MEVVSYLILALFDFVVAVLLFFGVNKIKVTSKSLMVMFVIRIIVAIIMTIMSTLALDGLFLYFRVPVERVVLSFILFKNQSKTMKIFNGLFPHTIWNLFFRTFTLFIFPMFGDDYLTLDGQWLSLFIDLMAIIAVFLFLKWLDYDFTLLRNNLLDDRDKGVLKLANWIMVSYHFVIQFMTYYEFEQSIKTHTLRQLIVVGYLILFMGIIKQLDTHFRQKLQDQLNFQRNMQLSDLENYNNHIEALYREVRGFRHDYANLLMTLRLGIENNDMSQIKEVYDSVLKDSNKNFKHTKYDVGRLVNIQNSALKSLLAAKISQASANHVSVSVEIPDLVELKGIALVDFINIISNFLDNALEETVGFPNSTISIAYFESDNKQLFIIENSMREQRIDTTEIYEFGRSRKEVGRGVGLYNVMTILERYPNVSLKTSSCNFKFNQTIKINL